MSEPTPIPDAQVEAEVQDPPELDEEMIQRIVDAGQEAYQALCDEVVSTLRERYDREFDITRSITSIGDGTIRFVIRTSDGAEPDLTFSAIAIGDSLWDDYVPNLCLYPLVKTVEETLPGTLACAAILYGESHETDASLTLDSLLDRDKDRRVLLRIVAQEGFEPSRDEVIQTVEELSRVFSAKIALAVWTLDEPGFRRCEGLFRSLPSVSATLIEKSEPLSSWSLLVQSGTSGQLRESEVS